PRELIRKEVRLTKEERRQMERHIDLTLEAIKDIQFDLPVPDTLAEMHERLDGSGYPKGVSGDAISRLGRILAVADVYAARTAPRSYRRAATPEDVLDILRNNGAKYDQRVVAALESYLKREKGRSPQGGASGKA
ncbi:MAG: HD domain-containing phosphohydrolase, partial [Rhodospirillaceae bacterium]|nr:HD domain-containing phosphohydrolase [Rhodospirillaceae bacterium]